MELVSDEQRDVRESAEQTRGTQGTGIPLANRDGIQKLLELLDVWSGLERRV